MVPSASSASIAASIRCRSLSSGRNSPAAMFQFKSRIVTECRDQAQRLVGMLQVEPADRRRCDRGRLDLAIGQRRNDLILEHERRGGGAALGQRHRDHRADRHPDPLIGTETGQRRRGQVGADREHDAAAMIGARYLHAARGRHVLAGDGVEHEVAIGAAILDRADHPLPHQLDAELLGNLLAKLDLKSRDRSGLAGKWQRVGIGAERQRPALDDGFQRAGIRRCASEQQQRQASRASAKRSHGILAARALVIEPPNVGEDGDDLAVAEH